MSREENLQWIRECIEEISDIPQDEIREDSRLIQDLDMSSLEIMSVVSALEKKKRVRFPSGKIREFVRVGDIADYLDTI